MPAPGLRERKKLRTRREIFEAASSLFAERGFDAVTVAEIARAADVSEVTVFNHFPTKEDLFYGGMTFFEEELVREVRDRPPGESALAVFRRVVLAGAPRLASRQSAGTIARVAAAIAASPSLRTRELEIVNRYTEMLAAGLAEETGEPAGAPVPLAVAGALMSAHRALVCTVRTRVAAGSRGPELEDEFRAQADRLFTRLETGLGAYAVRAGGPGRSVVREAD